MNQGAETLSQGTRESGVSFNREDEQRVTRKLSGNKALIDSTTLILCPDPRIFDGRDNIASKVDITPDPKGLDSTKEDWWLNK